MKNKKTVVIEDVKLPIKCVVKYSGTTHVYTLARGDVLKCIFCGEKLIVADRTAMKLSGVECIRCPECGRTASILYYLDKKVGHVVWEETDEIHTEETSRDSS